MGSLSLLQGIFLTQESNQGLLHCRWILYQLSYRATAEVYIKGVISVSPDSCIYSYIKKHYIPSLEMSVFLLLNNNSLMFWLPGLLLQKLLYLPTPHLASLEQFSQRYLRCWVLGLSLQRVCRINHNSQFLGCVFFQSAIYRKSLFCMTFKKNVWLFLRLVPFTQQGTERFIHVIVCIEFICFSCWVVPHCMDISKFAYL